MKTCIKCGVKKPVEAFAGGGLRNACKPCLSAQVIAIRKRREADGGAREKRRLAEKAMGVQCCKMCGVEKPLSEFHASAHHKRLGVNGRCKVCISEAAKQWKADNREVARARSRAWHKRYPEKSKYYADHRSPPSPERKIELRTYFQRWAAKPEIKAKMAEQRRRWYAENKALCLARSRAYTAQKARAMPLWLTDSDISAMNEKYREAARLTQETGFKYEVDHIVPLNGEFVCGLHVPWNLQVITAAENRSKSNKLLEAA